MADIIKHTLSTALRRSQEMMPSLALKELCVDESAARKLAQFAERHCGKCCLVVSDENTRSVAGKPVLAALSGAGKDIREKVFGREPLDASEILGEEVALAGVNADFYVAIGAGTLSDLAKHAGSKQNKPVLLFPTAASMNGYTSGIVALKVRGLKRTQPCTPATGVFADPNIVATAPQRMVAAGVADFLSKGSSASDWRAAHYLRGETYSEAAMEFYNGVQETVFDAAPSVGKGESAAVAVVLEALLLSGLSMLVAGSSAPASGGEHLISHFIDMKQALYGTPHDLHGVQVGVATIHCLRLWEKVLKLDATSISVDDLVAAHPSDETIRKWIESDWGPVAGEVAAQWMAKSLSRDALRAELMKLRNGLDELRELIRPQFIPAEQVEQAIAQSGGPTRPEEMIVSMEIYRDAVKRSRYIRNRFTILDLAAELGIE